MPLMVTFTNLEGSRERIDLDACKWHERYRVIRCDPPPGRFPPDFPLDPHPPQPPEVRWIFETRDNPPRWILAFRASIPRSAITTADGRYTPGAEQPSPEWPYHEIRREQAKALMGGYGHPLPASLTEAADPGDPTGTEGDRTRPSSAGSDASEKESPAAVPLPDQIRRRWPRREYHALLVVLMTDRESATYLEVAEHVYGDDTTDGGAIKQLVIRTNETLVELGARFQFRCGGQRVYKEPIES